ncbi:MAG TPA: hypothetical protein VJI67_00075, partial [archaeon]|nr:hypothetical protein [archaeon]
AALLVFSIAFFPSIAFSQSTAAKCGVASLTTSEDCNGAGYKKAGWTCYDDSSSSERDENCKSYEDWKAKATSYCEGKCEPATAECTDSDNGKDVYTYGKATGGDGHTRYDVCLSDSNLFEAYCPTPTHPHSDYASIICPDGTTCSGGVCVKKDQCSWGEWRSYQCSSQCGNLKEACKQGYYCQERKDSCGNLEGRCLYSPDCDKSCDITSKSLGSCSPTECGDRKCDSGQRCVKYLDSCGKTSYDCVYDSDCAGSEVKEEVKCVFQGATSGSSGKCGVNSFEVVSECENGFRRASWSCYDGTTSVQGGDSSCKPSSTWRQYAEEFCKGLCSGETQSHECYSEKGKCTGVGSCVVDVVGKRGEEVVWKSSCGGYAYTYVDGESEHAVFDCAPQACYTTSKSAGGCGPIECGDRKCDSGEQCLKYYDSCGATAYSCVSTRDCLEKGFCGDGVCTSEESREVCSTYCEAGIGSVPGKCYTNCFTGCDSDCRPKEICGDGVCQESEKSCKTSCAQAVVRGGFDEEAIKSQTEQCESYCSTNCPRDCDIEKRYCGDGVCEDYEKQKVCEASACPPCPAGADCSPCAPPVCESYCRVDCRD